MQGMYEGITKVIDWRCSESKLKHFVVSFQRVRPCLGEVLDSLGSKVRYAVLRRHAQDAGSVEEVGDALILEVATRL